MRTSQNIYDELKTELEQLKIKLQALKQRKEQAEKEYKIANDLKCTNEKQLANLEDEQTKLYYKYETIMSIIICALSIPALFGIIDIFIIISYHLGAFAIENLSFRIGPTLTVALLGGFVGGALTWKKIMDNLSNKFEIKMPAIIRKTKKYQELSKAIDILKEQIKLEKPNYDCKYLALEAADREYNDCNDMIKRKQHIMDYLGNIINPPERTLNIKREYKPDIPSTQ